METNTVITGLYLTFLCLFVSVESQFSVTFTGDTLFPLNSDAKLRCEFFPIPDNLAEASVGWFKISDGETVKIGKSTIDPDSSNIFLTGPDELKERFTMSSESFGDGVALATIANVTIEDASRYSCDVEATMVQRRSTFTIDVFQIPVVEIEVVQSRIDIRPTPEVVNLDSDNAEENSTAEVMVDEVTEFPPESTPEPPPADGKILIARCHVSGTYPEPSKVEFKAISDFDEILQGEIEDTIQNADGTYNVTAILMLEPTPQLDNARLECTAYITDNDMTASSTASEPLSVMHETTYVRIYISPRSTVEEGEMVSISCDSDGNPAPIKTINLPSGDDVDVNDGPHTFRANRNSAGVYRCAARDFKKEINDFKQLRVKWMDEPKISGPTVVKQKEDVTLSCMAASSGQVDYRWRKDGKVVSDVRTLRLGSVDASQGGTYICSAKRGVSVKHAEHNLEVQMGCEPRLVKHIASSPVKAGQAFVKLTCTAEGSPECKMTMTSYQNIKARTKGNEAVLIIEALPKQMQPLKFTCEATNDISSNSVNALLDHEDTCCHQPAAGGVSGGVIVLIIVIVAFIALGLPLAFFLLRRRSSPSSSKSQPTTDEEAKERLKP